MLDAISGSLFIFIILFLVIWILLSMWIARRVNLPLISVILLGFIPYVNSVSTVVLLICAILNYDLGKFVNLSNSSYVPSSGSSENMSNPVFKAPKSFPPPPKAIPQPKAKSFPPPPLSQAPPVVQAVPVSSPYPKAKGFPPPPKSKGY